MKATYWFASIALWIALNAQRIERSGLHFELEGRPFVFAGANSWDSMRIFTTLSY